MIRFEKDDRYSELFKDVLKSGKGLNLSMNKCYVLRKLLDVETLGKWDKFEADLKQLKLKLNYFVIGFNEAANHYHITYEVEHKTLSNAPLKIDRGIDLNIPFAFVPGAMSVIVSNCLDDLPIEQLHLVSKGH